MDILDFVSQGTIYQVAQPFLDIVGNQINNIIMGTIQSSMADSHKFFRKLPGGRQRKRQQVGRTSAGFSGGTSFSGRSTLVRAGTGRRQLKRRLSLRRRKGKSINSSRKEIKIG